MHPTTFEDRTISELDHIRISRLARNLANARPLRANDAHTGALIDALDAADVLSPHEVPADVVTMNSRILVEDAEGGGRRELTLCYPDEADPARGFVSVLSPIGAALLGRRTSQSVSIASPGQGHAVLRIVALTYQPEANGEFTR